MNQRGPKPRSPLFDLPETNSRRTDGSAFQHSLREPSHFRGWCICGEGRAGRDPSALWYCGTSKTERSLGKPCSCRRLSLPCSWTVSKRGVSLRPKTRAISPWSAVLHEESGARWSRRRGAVICPDTPARLDDHLESTYSQSAIIWDSGRSYDPIALIRWRRCPDSHLQRQNLHADDPGRCGRRS
jgi:hypothetical protein